MLWSKIFIQTIYRNTLSKSFIKALCQSPLSNHFIKVRYQSSSSKSFIKALYQSPWTMYWNNVLRHSVLRQCTKAMYQDKALRQGREQQAIKHLCLTYLLGWAITKYNLLTVLICFSVSFPSILFRNFGQSSIAHIPSSSFPGRGLRPSRALISHQGTQAPGSRIQRTRPGWCGAGAEPPPGWCGRCPGWRAVLGSSLKTPEKLPGTLEP